MSAEPDISVVVPVRNVALWIRECLSSILDDQDVDLEVIVVDDHSTDDTRAVVAERAGSDARVRLASAPGSGGGQARNHGVELSRGRYLAFCDGDDLVPRGAYAKMLASARESDPDMVIGDFLKFWPNHTKRHTANWAAFDEPRTGVTLTQQPSLIRNRSCWNRLFVRQFWLDTKISFPTTCRSDDIVPMTSALIAARRINVLTEYVYLYRARHGSMSDAAKAGSPKSFASYLAQEARSSSLVHAAGSAELNAEHDDTFLSADGWVHLRCMLTQLSDEPVNDADLEKSAGDLKAILGAVADDTLETVPLDRRWVFALAGAGRWAEARRLALALKPASAPMPDVAWFAEQARHVGESPLRVSDLLRKTIVHKLLKPLVRDDVRPELVTLTDLANYSAELKQAFPDDMRTMESPGVQRLLKALSAGDERVLEKVVDKGLFGLEVASLDPDNDNRAILTDGWVHVRTFLDGQDESSVADNDLTHVRDHYAQALVAASEKTLEAVPLDRRWVFVLAGAGRWAEARRLALALKPASAPMPDVAWFAEQARHVDESPLRVSDLLRKTIVHKLLKPLVRDDVRPALDTLTDLANYPAELKKAFPAAAIGQESLGVQLLLNALIDWNESLLAEVAAKGLFELEATSVDVRMNSVTLLVRLHGPAIEELTPCVSSGNRNREFGCVSVSGDVPEVRIELPLAALDQGKWLLRMVVKEGDVSAVGPVRLRSDAVLRERRRFDRAVIRADDRQRTISLEVLAGMHRRVVRKFRRFIRP